MKRLAVLAAALGAAALAGCDVPPSRSLGVVLVRDGRADPAALVATGAAGGAAPIQNVTCQLQTQTAAVLPGCAFQLRKGGAVYGPYLPLGPGRYAIDFEVGAQEDCAGAKVVFDVVTYVNGFKPLAARTVTIGSNKVESLAFTVDRQLADEAPLEFRTAVAPGEPGCLLLRRVTVRSL